MNSQFTPSFKKNLKFNQIAHEINEINNIGKQFLIQGSPRKTYGNFGEMKKDLFINNSYRNHNDSDYKLTTRNNFTSVDGKVFQKKLNTILQDTLTNRIELNSSNGIKK